MITIKCPACLVWLHISDDKAGKHGKCPKCGQPIMIPSPAAAAAPHPQGQQTADSEAAPVKGCPKCGSRRRRFAPKGTDRLPPPKGLAAFTATRDCICKDCGCQYQPPLPASVPYVLLVSGLILALFSVAVIIIGVSITSGGFSGNIGNVMLFVLVMLLGGCMAVAGAKKLRAKKKSSPSAQ
ncbi:MAG: hypothetical protein ABFD92_04820 [Planctomycetaceae bacterium]|nr:hypothetical protein [Planctomycetaceae bacterium]